MVHRLGLLVLLAGCTSADIGPGVAPDASAASLGTFELTYYWVAYEGDYTGVADTPLYDDACGVLATVSAPFADAIALEGTGRLLDGRLLNLTGACPCPQSPCYVEADDAHPWGYGVDNRALEPFRTIAVDPTVIAYGDGIYLPVLDGSTMPGESPWGGFEHDGCVVAGDTGSDIAGMHIDLFVGLQDAYLALDDALGLTELEVVDGGDRCPDQP